LIGRIRVKERHYSVLMLYSKAPANVCRAGHPGAASVHPLERQEAGSTTKARC
jgi:hypothetical protein